MLLKHCRRPTHCERQGSWNVMRKPDKTLAILRSGANQRTAQELRQITFGVLC